MIWIGSLVYCICAVLTFQTISDAKSLQRNRRDAAENPSSEPCALDRYRCDSGSKCIPLQWICDGYSDCLDKLDERNCISANQNATVSKLTVQQLQDSSSVFDDETSSTRCPDGKTFSCDHGNKCVKMSSLCDTITDCNDGTDELNCPAKTQVCESSKFSCDNGAKCLPLTWLCDSIDDCADHKDEHNCPNKKHGISVAQAAQEAAVTAAKEAKRAALAAQELMKTANQAAMKAKKAMQMVKVNS